MNLQNEVDMIRAGAGVSDWGQDQESLISWVTVAWYLSHFQKATTLFVCMCVYVCVCLHIYLLPKYLIDH